MSANDDTFFDIHMHALNLSHPYFYAFLKRYKLIPESLLDTGIKFILIAVAAFSIVFTLIIGLVFLLGSLSFLVSAVISIICFVLLIAGVLLFPPLRRYIKSQIAKIRKKLTNMLSIFENDIGSFFLITEDCLREKENPLLKNNKLIIGAETQNKLTYQRIVLTPLMMDFGYKGKKKGTQEKTDYHYNRPSEKPIIEQVTDVFNAIKKYKRSLANDDELSKKYPYLKPGTQRIFEIYPFLGINTRNYELEEIKDLLDKYFIKPDKRDKKYEGSRTDLCENMGTFDGDLDHIPSNFFAGVKIYPPLEFDPWPADDNELKKVKYLYAFCVEHRIPITSHSGSGGFVAIDDKKVLKDYTAISKWESVLGKNEYATLKLNIAHFPAEFESQRVLTRAESKEENQRLHAIINLITAKDNVYTDFSCRAWNDDYYMHLRNVLDSLSDGKRDRLSQRIMFGSDFPVNLVAIESYNKYVDIFSRTGHLTREEKHSFCCVNPQRFLFSSD